MLAAQFPGAIQLAVGLRQNVLDLACIGGAQGHFDQRHCVVEVSGDIGVAQLSRLAEGVLCRTELLLPEHHHAKRIIDRCSAVVDLAGPPQNFQRFGGLAEPVKSGAKSKMRIEVVVVLCGCFAQKNYTFLQLAVLDLRHALFVSGTSGLRNILYKTGARRTESRFPAWMEAYLYIDHLTDDLRRIRAHEFPYFDNLPRPPVFSH